MKSNDNSLDALRAQWRRYGDNLAEVPSPVLTFADRSAADRPWALPVTLGVAWILLSGAAVRWIPPADYYNVTGSCGDTPEAALSQVQSMLETV